MTTQTTDCLTYKQRILTDEIDLELEKILGQLRFRLKTLLQAQPNAIQDADILSVEHPSNFAVINPLLYVLLTEQADIVHSKDPDFQAKVKNLNLFIK
jgi:hypothetical protein